MLKVRILFLFKFLNQSFSHWVSDQVGLTLDVFDIDGTTWWRVRFRYIFSTSICCKIPSPSPFSMTVFRIQLHFDIKVIILQHFGRLNFLIDAWDNCERGHKLLVCLLLRIQSPMKLCLWEHIFHLHHRLKVHQSRLNTSQCHHQSNHFHPYLVHQHTVHPVLTFRSKNVLHNSGRKMCSHQWNFLNVLNSKFKSN